jgi:hypothetical protein
VAEGEEADVFHGGWGCFAATSPLLFEI